MTTINQYFGAPVKQKRGCSGCGCAIVLILVGLFLMLIGTLASV